MSALPRSREKATRKSGHSPPRAASGRAPILELAELRRQLRAAARPDHAAVLRRFFKTGPGDYGEGDVFLGVRVPAIRALVRRAGRPRLAEIIRLLQSPFHEERLLALLLLVRRFERGTLAEKAKIFQAYLAHASRINNWDLVDLSAPHIVGAWLLDRPRSQLRQLAASPSLWRRRMAVLATFAFIRAGQYDDTLELCRLLLNDPHDLLHKACGWMLREIGKREPSCLLGFLEAHAAAMPRAMLRYAIERLPERQRRGYLRRRS
mgnify:CR=1 FL=1